MLSIKCLSVDIVCFNMVVYFSKEYHNETKIPNPKAYGGMVKWLSQQTFNLPVPGSNPSAPTILKHIILTDNTVTGKLRLHFSVFQYGHQLTVICPTIGTVA